MLLAHTARQLMLHFVLFYIFTNILFCLTCLLQLPAPTVVSSRPYRRQRWLFRIVEGRLAPSAAFICLLAQGLCSQSRVRVVPWAFRTSFNLRTSSVYQAPNCSSPSHCLGLHHPILLCHFHSPVATLCPSPSVPEVMQFAIIFTCLCPSFTILFLGSSVCSAIPRSFSSSMPGRPVTLNTLFSLLFIPTSSEQVVHKCDNLRWGCCFFGIKRLSNSKNLHLCKEPERRETDEIKRFYQQV